ncbi:probable carboxylesterase 15 [Oryza brachyantha]|uniref:probable carboxylesterase 15 n=1 Tax=Oryza brachyantha TaxID=4533 RepID=UPI001ADCD597|nr:probable carboxylesterase 15 [Oryza brachyantha]XP_040381735.1 probable carboxylesterase 15 [Oryza brachyantha]XP_040381736.1 probable carboxylesterase 15 [Oryza brachyantha]
MSSSPSSSSPASAVAGRSPPVPHVVEDCLGIVQLLSDGTVTRSSDYSALALTCNAPSDLPVRWKDAVYDAGRGLRLRMYTPTSHDGEEKLPVLVYFHGGGFCIASFELPNFHSGALRLAAELPGVVLSADYRLAPEHRLPAAHEDAASVLSWLRGQAAPSSSSSTAAADPWLVASADFDRVFVCGDSCGGNIAHHFTVGCASGKIALGPARLAGCVMLWPYFGGEEKMEAPPPADTSSAMNIALFDQMWRLALPAGATRDHPAANPFGPESPPLDGVVFPPVLIVDPEQDVLRDRVADYAARLEAMGKRVELVKFQGQGHGFFVFDPMSEASDELVRVVRRFVYGG